MEEQKEGVNRRDLIRTGARVGSLLGLGALVGYAANLFRSRATRRAGTERRMLGDEFRYDVSQFQKTDPKLIRYEETSSFPTGLQEARALHIGTGERVHVAGDQVLRTFEPDGRKVSEIVLDAPPRCVFETPEGDLFVGHKNQVTVHDSKGKPKTKWENFADRTLLTDLAVTKEDVFLADAGNRIVLRFDRSGKEVCRIGQNDPSRNIPGFVVPSPFFSLAIAPDGLLRVANPGRHLIEAYTFDGDLEFSWGKASMAVDGFCGCCNPVSFAILPDGKFVTCEKGIPRVKVYDAEGNFQAVVAGFERFEKGWAACSEGPAGRQTRGMDVAVDSTGRIFILNVYSGNVMIMTKKGY